MIEDDTEFKTLAESVPEIPPDMGPGVLTETQRKYIDGFADIEAGSAHERTVRSRIRKRIINSVKDFRYLELKLEDRDVRQAAESANTDVLDGDIGRAFELLLRLKYYSEDRDGSVQITDYSEWVEKKMQAALGQVFVKDGRFVEDIDVNVKIELGEEMSERDELEELSAAELVQMHNSGELNDRDFIEELMRREDSDTLA